MTAKAQRVKGFPFESQQRLFFDTNIWLFLYGANNAPNDQGVKTYSTAFKRAKDAGATIEIDSVVLGEFINRSLRDDYALLHPPQSERVDFKTYRQSLEYAASARAVARNVREILAQCERVESAFARCDIAAVIADFETTPSDWSDQMIVALCRERDLILVTDDGDFGDSGLTILTRNSNYFASAAGD